jgi:hypothetical protein
MPMHIMPDWPKKIQYMANISCSGRMKWRSFITMAEL